MVYEERNAWAGLIVSPIALVVYVVLVLAAGRGRALTAVDWFPPHAVDDRRRHRRDDRDQHRLGHPLPA